MLVIKNLPSRSLLRDLKIQEPSMTTLAKLSLQSTSVFFNQPRFPSVILLLNLMSPSWGPFPGWFVSELEAGATGPALESLLEFSKRRLFMLNSWESTLYLVSVSLSQPRTQPAEWLSAGAPKTYKCLSLGTFTVLIDTGDISLKVPPDLMRLHRDLYLLPSSLHPASQPLKDSTISLWVASFPCPTSHAPAHSSWAFWEHRTSVLWPGSSGQVKD
jgi:hypothetical protein